MPTSDVWRRVTRKADVLQEVKNVTMSAAADLSHSDTRKRHSRFDLVVTMMRVKLRQQDMTTQPTTERPMVSITGEPLDIGLADILHTARMNYVKYKDDYARSGKFGSEKLTPIFVTQEEHVKYDSIESKTKKEIKLKIIELLDAMPDVEEAQKLKGSLENNLKRKKKAFHVEMYYDMVRMLDEQLAAAVVEDVEDPFLEQFFADNILYG